MRFDEIERLIDERLRDTPAPMAPPTLLPRVMQAVRHQSPRPGRDGWRTWPALWRLASAAAAVLLIAGAIRILPEARDVVAAGLSGPADWFGAAIGGIQARAVQAVGAAQVIWRLAIAPVAVCLSLFVVVMIWTSAMFGSALFRIAAGGVAR